MAYLCFRAPDGAEWMGAAATEEAERRLLTAGASYWSTGAGDAALWAGNPYDPVQLQLYFDARDRFQLRFITPGAMPLYSHAPSLHDPSPHGPSCSIVVGGNHMELDAGTLVSRRCAARAARHFATLQEPDPGLEWI